MVDAPVHCLDRGRIRADVSYMLEGHSLATATDPNPESVRGEGPVYNLVIEHPDATVLWDTGCHPRAASRWPSALADAFEPVDIDEHRLPAELDAVGFDLDDIDAVVMSHLHLDHAGGLEHFAGTDVPVFAHRAELEHAYYSAKTGDGDDAYLAADFDHDLNWQPVHRRRERHFDDLEFLQLPGHTPGVLAVLLRRPAGALVFAGDHAYVRANYDDGIPLGPTLLWDRPAWRDSQRWLEDLERRHDATVFCGHDPDDFDRLRQGLP